MPGRRLGLQAEEVEVEAGVEVRCAACRRRVGV